MTFIIGHSKTKASYNSFILREVNQLYRQTFPVFTCTLGDR